MKRPLVVPMPAWAPLFFRVVNFANAVAFSVWAWVGPHKPSEAPVFWSFRAAAMLLALLHIGNLFLWWRIRVLRRKLAAYASPTDLAN